MICENCGAEIEKTDLLCPYCGAENIRVALKEHSEEMEEIEEKTKEMEQLPEKVATKATKVTGRMLFLIFVCAAVVLTVIAGVSSIQAKTAFSKQEKQLAKLEKYYENQQYAEMTEYFEKLSDGYRDTYGKYETTAYMYRDLERLKDSWKSDVEYRKQGVDRKDIFENDVKTGLMLLYDIKLSEEEQYRYGEEDAVAEFKNQTEKILKDEMNLTDEEIREGLLIAEQEYEKHNSGDFSAFGKAVYERMELK